MSIIPPLQEAELKVMIKNVYKNGGAKEVMIVINEMAYCLGIVIETLKECLNEDKK